MAALTEQNKVISIKIHTAIFIKQTAKFPETSHTTVTL